MLKDRLFYTSQGKLKWLETPDSEQEMGFIRMCSNPEPAVLPWLRVSLTESLIDLNCQSQLAPELSVSINTSSINSTQSTTSLLPGSTTHWQFSGTTLSLPSVFMVIYYGLVQK